MIDGKTRVYGVFGYPVAHTLSPAMHNAGFRSLGLNCTYVAFEVNPKEIGKTLRALPLLGIKGVNLTIPHKELALSFLHTLSKEARLIGAVNTVIVEGKRLKGYNTDGIGFVKAIKKDLNFTPQGKRVLVLGAGGAARALSMQLALKGVSSLWFYDVRKAKMTRLVSDIKTHFPRCEVRAVKESVKKIALDGFDLLVNATPVGMKKNDPLLIDPGRFVSTIRVYDLVYNVGDTKLVRAAKKKGIKASSGLNMLLYQGAASFKLWTGRKAPLAVMKRAMKKGLGI